ncbi:MAG: DinB family protein [Chloroflexota bacterium]
MNGTLLADAFGHHVWATLTLLDTCAALTPEQLTTSVPGTFGPLIDTLRHLVGADCSYLELLSGGKVQPLADEETADVARLRAAMEANGPVWAELVAGDLDPTAVVVRHRDDGSSFHAPLTIRLAQVVHHGTDHRSQVCTALTNLGVTPPDIDAWDYAASQGRTFEVPAPGR